jgi:crossover junction endodeoxyribonuclease RuvC
MESENLSEQIIMGIDPGTRVMGYAFLEVVRKKLHVMEMGVLTFSSKNPMQLRLKEIFEDVTTLVERFKPDVLAIEEPFYGKNVQSMLKLGRAQGSAMVAAVSKGLKVFEYAPRKAKMAICGNGAASKEQVALMVEKTLGIDIRSKYLDATDALAAAYCHYMQMGRPETDGTHYRGWKDFINKNKDKVWKNKTPK